MLYLSDISGLIYKADIFDEEKVLLNVAIKILYFAFAIE